ncbi:MAG TPA: Fe-S-containing hydro-lyase [Deltaproteobacteria bacterium]|nr:Fe-S-containing hydro-lyase [Deltaproteobacteria bacterium]
MDFKRITPPLTEEIVEGLRAGDKVFISGTIYAARDQAHKRMFELIQKGEPLPFDIGGQIIYYVGPTPPREGMVIGSAGPTTSSRMDEFTPALLKAGLKATIGKGARSSEVKEALKRFKAVYFVSVGGAGALLSQRIKKAEVVAYPELGTEAIRRLEVEDFPVIVAYDMYGGDLFKEGVEKYRKV